jgi:transketolase
LRLTRDPSPVVFPKNHEFRLGKAELLRIGGDIGLIGTGTQTIRVLEAADLLAARGIEAAVLHIPTLKPLDVDAIVALAERVDRIVTAEDHSIIGGLGGAVAECLGEHRPTRIRRIGIRDVFGESAANDALLEKYGLTAAHVADAAVSLLDGERS